MIPHTRLPRLVALAALLIVLLLPACGASGSDDSGMPSVGGAPAQDGGGVAYPEEGMPEEDGGDEDGRMLIRTKTLRLEVESTPDALDQVRDLARSHDGSVTDMQVATEDEWIYRYDEHGDGAALRGWVTVRVPVAEFDAFVAEAGQIGRITYQSEATTDVTQEHVDLSARLENLRAQEVRLREFFDAAEDVKDMLAIEKELGRVRGEIESLDAQVTYLERQAAMATVTVELVEPRAVVRPGGESWGFLDAITDGIRGAAAVLTGALTFLIATSPIWLAALVLFFPVRAWLRRRRRGPVTTPSPPPEDPEA